jgi:hypothetical protein
MVCLLHFVFCKCNQSVLSRREQLIKGLFNFSSFFLYLLLTMHWEGVNFDGLSYKDIFP